jgi:hypothetical protein
MVMKRLFALPAIAALALAGGAAAAEPPTLARNGLPITPHQLQVLGPDGVEEQACASMLTLDGMPATPHQIKALRQDDQPTQ